MAKLLCILCIIVFLSGCCYTQNDLHEAYISGYRRGQFELLEDIDAFYADGWNHCNGYCKKELDTFLLPTWNYATTDPTGCYMTIVCIKRKR
jgi:hypothetical protein